MSVRLEWAGIHSATLNIPLSLDSGQTFRWICLADGDWIGVIADSMVRLRPAEQGFWWQTWPRNGRWDLIARYFALDVDLDALYSQWLASEPRIGPSIERNRGLRILRQDAEEALFGFMCASCNTVLKIKRSVSALAATYGEALGELDGHTLHRFPQAESLASASENVLRSALWGYRAPRLISVAQIVSENGGDWLQEMRSTAYEDAHAELTAMHGIGAKIADCICLFAFWHDEACPVDTHVRRIATRLYSPELAAKSLTPAVYNTLAALFRQRFGQYAGWAQQYFFLDELNHAEDR